MVVAKALAADKFAARCAVASRLHGGPGGLRRCASLGTQAARLWAGCAADCRPLRHALPHGRQGVARTVRPMPQRSAGGNPPAHALRAGEAAGANAAGQPSATQTSRFTHAAYSCLPRDDHVSRRWSESLCDQHLREQPGVGMPLAMISAGTGAWVSVRHLCAGPLAADVALYREYARCVVQLLADARLSAQPHAQQCSRARGGSPRAAGPPARRCA